MTENNGKSAVDAPLKSKKMRSPAYPGINLEIATKRAKGLFEKERRNAVAYRVAVSHWGFGEKSSGGLLSIAALKSFGLIEDVQRGAGGRIIKLTDLALRIILDERPDSAQRAVLIKQAALNPKIHAALWKKYGTELPSDSSLHHELIFDFKFNENTVDEFIKEYKETIRFAGLADSDKVSPSVEDKITDDDGSEATEEENIMQVQEVTQNSTKGNVQPPPGKPVGKPVGASIPVSKNCVISVSASGEVTQKGLKKLIDYLNLIKDSFPESDEQEPAN
jgi:hypothetical protein